MSSGFYADFDPGWICDGLMPECYFCHSLENVQETKYFKRLFKNTKLEMKMKLELCQACRDKSSYFRNKDNVKKLRKPKK